jgi:hypothetical protein
MELLLLDNDQINKTKWNETIGKAYNGVIYAYSWYLDIVAPNWKALVSKDYKFVMPLTVKSKLGINYISQPFFMQQGGVFSENLLNENILKQFIASIPEYYKYVNLNFNVYNNESNIFKRKSLTMHLDIVEPYQKIYSCYNSNTKRNVKESIKNNLSIYKSIDSKSLIQLFKTTKARQLKGVTDKHYNILEKLIAECKARQHGEIYGVFNENKIIAAAFMLKSHNKTINLFNASSPEGYNKKAMFFLFDSFFRSNAEKVITFDFEGSKVPGVARFYKGFGAKTVEFPILYLNKLSFPFNYLIK